MFTGRRAALRGGNLARAAPLEAAAAFVVGPPAAGEDRPVGSAALR